MPRKVKFVTVISNTSQHHNKVVQQNEKAMIIEDIKLKKEAEEQRLEEERLEKIREESIIEEAKIRQEKNEVEMMNRLKEVQRQHNILSRKYRNFINKYGFITVICKGIEDYSGMYNCNAKYIIPSSEKDLINKIIERAAYDRKGRCFREIYINLDICVQCSYSHDENIRSIMNKCLVK